MWHFHIHVIPLWKGDAFFCGEHVMRLATLSKQHEHAAKLRAARSWST